MKLLVGSVFIDDSPVQQQWLDLQLRFLKDTTDSFDHVALLSQGSKTDTFEKRTRVIVPKDMTMQGSLAHEQGLNELLDYFRNNANEYSHFLIIDGDAFPMKKNWMGSLLQKMQPEDQFDNFGSSFPLKPIGRSYDIAVALRCENLESRLHASILFAKKTALEHLSFVYGGFGTDLVGRKEIDIFIPKYQTELRHLALPLLRTNKFNLHPLACGIYFDSFYHHCCGSGRPFHLRASDGYLNKIIQPLGDLSNFTTMLMENPSDFVSKLAGWNPNRYAKI